MDIPEVNRQLREVYEKYADVPGVTPPPVVRQRKRKVPRKDNSAAAKARRARNTLAAQNTRGRQGAEKRAKAQELADRLAEKGELTEKVAKLELNVDRLKQRALQLLAARGSASSGLQALLSAASTDGDDSSDEMVELQLGEYEDSERSDESPTEFLELGEAFESGLTQHWA